MGCTLGGGPITVVKPNDPLGRATDKCSVTSDCVGTYYKYRCPLTAARLIAF